MDIEYYVGGWHYTLRQGPFAKYLTVQLSPFEICKNTIIGAFKRNLHNIACGIAQMGKYQKVVMSATFHFSIFHINRYVKTKKLFCFRLIQALVCFWMMRNCWESLFNSLIMRVNLLFLHSFSTMLNLSLIL